MIDVPFLKTAVGGTRVPPLKAVIPVALNKGRTLPLLQMALDLRHNRKTRRNVGHVRAAWGSIRPPRRLSCRSKFSNCITLCECGHIPLLREPLEPHIPVQ